MRRSTFIVCAALVVLLATLPAIFPAAAGQAGLLPGASKVRTPPPTQPPLQFVDITKLPEGMERLDLFLLLGQSNMKGRGFMPGQPSRDPRIVMMHLEDDQWYVARHPLHLVGDAKTFAGADNAGVGPGLAFAESLLAREARARIGLIPCAVGGSGINLDSRDLKTHIGDFVHFDTAAQSEIGKRYAEKFFQLMKSP